MDPKRLLEILEENRNKEFVKRILNPLEYPVLYNQDGSHSTHSMAWAGPDQDGTSMVYPTIVRDGDRMFRLGPDTAKRYAIDKGEFIQFSNPEEADAFSKEYKKWWDIAGYRQPQ